MVDTTHFNDKFGDAGSYCFTNIIGDSHCQHIGIIVILGMIESPYIYIYTYTRIYIYGNIGESLWLVLPHYPPRWHGARDSPRHFIALDEPTNYLDVETVDALGKAPLAASGMTQELKALHPGKNPEKMWFDRDLYIKLCLIMSPNLGYNWILNFRVYAIVQ